MNLYLDDDTADRRLVALLFNAGHVVVVPASAHLAGALDARHFMHAIRQSLVLVTRNDVPPLRPYLSTGLVLAPMPKKARGTSKSMNTFLNQ